jgi:hypothetical protein
MLKASAAQRDLTHFSIILPIGSMAEPVIAGQGAGGDRAGAGADRGRRAVCEGEKQAASASQSEHASHRSHRAAGMVVRQG